MKIGIIGASGFIRQNLHNFLKIKKNYNVFSFPSYFKSKEKWTKKVIQQIKIKKAYKRSFFKGFKSYLSS